MNEQQLIEYGQKNDAIFSSVKNGDIKFSMDVIEHQINILNSEIDKYETDDNKNKIFLIDLCYKLYRLRG